MWWWTETRQVELQETLTGFCHFVWCFMDKVINQYWQWKYVIWNRDTALRYISAFQSWWNKFILKVIVSEQTIKTRCQDSVTSRTFILKVVTYSNICTFLFVTTSNGHVFSFQVKHVKSRINRHKVLVLAGHTTQNFSQWERTTWWEDPAEEEEDWWRIQAKFFFRKLMSPLVDESWELTSESSCSSGSIFFASCFPSSTLWAGNRKLVTSQARVAAHTWTSSHLRLKKTHLMV